MSQAALMQLVAKGEPDIYLTGNPQITFFKSVYKRHTNYSMQQLDVSSSIKGERKLLKKDVNEKKRNIEIVIPRNGDLLHVCYVNFDLPQIEDITTINGYQPRFFNSVGHLLIDEVILEIGGQQIDKQTGEWMEIWSQLSYDEAKQLGFKYMVGRVNNNSIQTYDDKPQGPLYLQVPLQFWFCKNIYSSLPLVALQYHDVKIKVTFNSLEHVISKGLNYHTAKLLQVQNNFYVLSPTLSICESEREVKLSSNCEKIGKIGPLIGSNLTTKINESTDTTNNSASFENTWSDLFNNKCFDNYLGKYTVFKLLDVTNLNPNNFNLNLNGEQDIAIFTEPVNMTEINTIISNYNSQPAGNIFFSVEYIFLSEVERKKILAQNSEYLIEQVQIKELPVKNNIESYDISEINLPIKSLYWIFRNKLNDSSQCNNIYPFNFSDTLNNTFLSQSDSINKVSLIFSNQNRIGENFRPEYFRLTQPFQHHTRNSTLFVYMYSFCLRPEDFQPTGSCNFSRLDNVELKVEHKTSLVGDRTLVVFALTQNILRINRGMGGLAYSN